MARDDIADFGTYLAEERHASQNTICSYLRDVTQFSAYLREHQSCTLRQAGGEMIQDYMSWMRGRGKSAASVTRFLASVKSFYNFLLSAGAVKANPAKSISADRAERKYPEILTSKEVGYWKIIYLTITIVLKILFVLSVARYFLHRQVISTVIAGQKMILTIGKYVRMMAVK